MDVLRTGVSAMGIAEPELNLEAGKQTAIRLLGALPAILGTWYMSSQGKEVPGEIDEERAQRALERTRERLEEKGPGLDYERAARALERARNRLKVVGRRG